MFKNSYFISGMLGSIANAVSIQVLQASESDPSCYYLIEGQYDY